MTNKNKAKLINKHFGVYGYGHFDIYTEELVEILDILEMENPQKFLKELYEKLAKQRLG